MILVKRAISAAIAAIVLLQVDAAAVAYLPLKSLTPYMTMRQATNSAAVPISSIQERVLGPTDILSGAGNGAGLGGTFDPAPVIQADATPPPAAAPAAAPLETEPGLGQPQNGPRLARKSVPKLPVAPVNASPAPKMVKVPGFRFACNAAERFRSISGNCNNLQVPTLGAANTPFIKLSYPCKGVRGRRRRNRCRWWHARRAKNRIFPSARVISNRVLRETRTKKSRRGLTELTTFFGQFMDHVLTETKKEKGRKTQKFFFPKNDPIYKTTQYIPFSKTAQVGSGRRRSPNNELSSYVDASAVYGHKPSIVRQLRSFKKGRLRLPGGSLPVLKGQVLAGDERSGENPNLSSMHLIFAKEHNRIAREVSLAFRQYNDEQIFQLARHILIAKLQAIVYYEFLPALTGRRLRKYRYYKPWVQARVSNRFSTVGYRVGHTMLNGKITAMTRRGKVTKFSLSESLFNLATFKKGGYSNFIRGMINTRSAEIDNEITGAVRNDLFNDRKAPMQADLAALNVLRGRDHNVPPCNVMRRSLRLPVFRDFFEISNNWRVAHELAKIYQGRINDVDAWVCGLAERHVRGSSLGHMFQRIVLNDFRRIRDGDRFYFERPGYFTRAEIRKIPTARRLHERKFRGLMKSVIVRNTNLLPWEVRENPFFIWRDYY